MNIKATEQHRLGTSVNVLFELDDDPPYNRFVDAATWDADPEAVIASVFEYLMNIPAPTAISDPIKLAPIEMTELEVNAKLEDIELAKNIVAEIKVK